MPKLSYIALFAALLMCVGSHALCQDMPDAPSSSQDQRQNVAKSRSVATPKLDHAQQNVADEIAPRRNVIDRNFMVLGALTFGLTAADMELTQHCLQERTCVELNPLLPHSRWGMYATNTPVNLAVMYLAYRRKARGKRDWWIAPLIDTGIHGVGIGSNIRFAW